MKVYVIGGMGFIGHHVVKELVDRGNECVVIDNYENYGILNQAELNKLYEEREYLMSNARIKFGDVREMQEFDDAEVIIHLASYPRAKAVDLNISKAADVMLGGTAKLCEAANRSNAKFVFISSSMVYGDWNSNYVYESQNCNPKSLYGIMKLQGEQLTRSICKDNYLIIRPSAVYGPRDVTDRVVSLMFKAAMSNKTIRVEGADNLLDFTYVDDLVTGIVDAALSGHKGHVVNMSAGNARSLGELAVLIKLITESNSVIDYTDHNARYPKRGAQDITAARELFNFNPTTMLEDGLKLTYDWLKNRNDSVQ